MLVKTNEKPEFHLWDKTGLVTDSQNYRLDKTIQQKINLDLIKRASKI